VKYAKHDKGENKDKILKPARVQHFRNSYTLATSWYTAAINNDLIAEEANNLRHVRGKRRLTGMQSFSKWIFSSLKNTICVEV
jgi:hypothetical protein